MQEVPKVGLKLVEEMTKIEEEVPEEMTKIKTVVRSIDNATTITRIKLRKANRKRSIITRLIRTPGSISIKICQDQSTIGPHSQLRLKFYQCPQKNK